MRGRCAHSKRKSLFSNRDEHAFFHDFHRAPVQLRHRIHQFMTAGLSATQMGDYASIGDFDAEARFFQLLNDNGFHGRHKQV